MPNKKLYKLTDGSWHVLLEDGKLTQEQPTVERGFLYGNKYEILATDLSLPALSYMGGHTLTDITNDTIVRDVDQGKIYFTHKVFLKEINVCPRCGKELEGDTR